METTERAYTFLRKHLHLIQIVKLVKQVSYCPLPKVNSILPKSNRIGTCKLYRSEIKSNINCMKVETSQV